jgi:hypothetical protein
MNTATSLVLVGAIVGFLLFDAIVHDWALSLFLAVKFTHLLQWAAFWR